MTARPPLYAFTKTGVAVHLIQVARPEWTLCHVWVYQVPVAALQPINPTLCPRCAQRSTAVEFVLAPPSTTGVCPVCVSDEDLDAAGRISQHKQMLGTARTDVDCDGAGELPDGDA